MIRQPDFITKDEFDWAVNEAKDKKKIDFSSISFLSVDEGLCVQCMHLGPYDEEPATIEKMHDFLSQNDYVTDFSEKRHHHEIYLSDPRRTKPERLKTVIRIPVQKGQSS